MAEGDLKLLGHWSSPFAFRVRIVLKQKGLSYEYLEEDLTNKSELLLKYNPIHKQVPVLFHNDRPLCESQVILQYIDEALSEAAPSVLPFDPYERAMARFWANYIDDKLLYSFFGILKATTKEAKAEKTVETMSILVLLEEAFKICSKGKAFFNGDTIGFVDVALGSLLPWIKATERESDIELLDETKYPMLVEWAKRFYDDDCAKGLLPEVEKIEEFITKSVKVRWAAAAAAAAASK